MPTLPLIAMTALLATYGACTPPDGPGNGDPECTTDANCDANEVCSSAGLCVPDDTDTNGEPPPECTMDADCAAGQMCSPVGVCVPDDDEPPGNGGECMTNADCAAGDTCTPEGLCVPEAGELPCASDDDCGQNEVCSPAGFCADANDPDPPGSGGGIGGGGGGGGGEVPTCTDDADCPDGQVCLNGLCGPDLGDPNFAAALAGCWEITFTDATGSVVAIYEFDSEGQLVRTWEFIPATGETFEGTRYTVPNATFFNGLYASTEQIVTLDETQTQLSVTSGVLFYGFQEVQGECRIVRTTVCTELTLMEATLSGDPPNTLVSGVFVGSRNCVSPSGNVDGFFDSAVTGQRLSACPDIAQPNVFSQEEQGDLCD
jgi:Cys-rich repeat protein